MKIKRFFAKDMSSAMNEVKEVLGSDAVIMSNKKVVGGIEIVAAVDYQTSQTEQKKQQPLENKKSQLNDFANLKEDQVQLSSKPNKILQPKNRKTESISSSDLKSKNFAKSLNEFFGKVEEHNAKKSPSPYGNKNNKPQTLGEQENWEPSGAKLKPTPLQKRSAPNRSNDQNEMSKISNEVASLRKLLEHQVSGLMWQEMERNEPVRAMVIKWLNKLGFSDEISDLIASNIPENITSAEVQKYIETILKENIYVGNNEILSKGGAIALLGPTGVGKTTTIAKLAAQFALKYGADQVALITTDTYRIGAHEQLATYGKIMGCLVRVAKDADELSTILYGFREKRLVLIDTAGMGQRDIRLSEQLDTLMKNSRVNIKSYLVISATSQRRVAQEALEHFKHIPLSGCILTKLDESIGLGEVLSVTMKYQIPISYITTGQRVPEDIEIADQNTLIDSTLNMMNELFEKDKHEWHKANDA